MTSFTVTGYGVIVKGAEVLLIERKKPPVWEFPGGGLKKGESIRDCISREVFEEVDIKIKPGLLIPVIEIEGHISVFGLCDYKDGNVVIDKNTHNNFKWVRLKEVPNVINGLSIARSVKSFLGEVVNY
ncbi:MAG: NUDIX domain-containing protein [Candidatus Altiarchaeota archaeon]|nr:NUDIX domain-containing protein [Candidatus Altiarchaeota archaeon]